MSAPIVCPCGGRCSGVLLRNRSMLGAMARDAEAVTGASAEFRCPLCARPLPATCASLAHAPSRRLGGRPVTLLCRFCNSHLSTLYEGKVVPELQRQAEAVSGTWTDTLLVGSGQPDRQPIRLPVRFNTPPEGSVEIHVGPAKGSAAVRSRWREEAEIIGKTGKGTIGGRIASQQQLSRTVVGWAFQAAAGSLGYRFALSAVGRLVGKALLDPGSTVLGERSRLNVEGQPLAELTPAYPVLWELPGSSKPDSWGWRFGAWIALLPLPWDEEGQIYRQLDVIAAAGGTSFGRGGEATLAAIASIFVPSDSTQPLSP